MVTPRPKPHRRPVLAKVKKLVETEDKTDDNIEILPSESTSQDDVKMREASPMPTPAKAQKRKRASPSLSVCF
jgi:hypothetical protein